MNIYKYLNDSVILSESKEWDNDPMAVISKIGRWGNDISVPALLNSYNHLGDNQIFGPSRGAYMAIVKELKGPASSDPRVHDATVFLLSDYLFNRKSMAKDSADYMEKKINELNKKIKDKVSVSGATKSSGMIDISELADRTKTRFPAGFNSLSFKTGIEPENYNPNPPDKFEREENRKRKRTKDNKAMKNFQIMKNRKKAEIEKELNRIKMIEQKKINDDARYKEKVKKDGSKISNWFSKLGERLGVVCNMCGDSKKSIALESSTSACIAKRNAQIRILLYVIGGSIAMISILAGIAIKYYENKEKQPKLGTFSNILKSMGGFTKFYPGIIIGLVIMIVGYLFFNDDK